MQIPTPPNLFKQALRGDRPLIGLWSNLCSPISVEITAGSGFDWLLLDAEHAPNEVPMLLQQLQALASGTAAAIVRPAWNDLVLIKRILDIGAQSLLIPYVQTPEEARAAVAATRYPPQGVRGVAVMHRANRYNRARDYFQRANEEICVILQVETRLTLDHLDAIAAVDGVDALFVGPSDLAASLGHIGNPGHPEVRAAIEEAGQRIRRAGKAAGILAHAEADAKYWLEKGFGMVGVGSDAGLLARQSEALAARFRAGTAGP